MPLPGLAPRTRVVEVTNAPLSPSIISLFCRPAPAQRDTSSLGDLHSLPYAAILAVGRRHSTGGAARTGPRAATVRQGQR